MNYLNVTIGSISQIREVCRSRERFWQKIWSSFKLYWNKIRQHKNYPSGKPVAEVNEEEYGGCYALFQQIRYRSSQWQSSDGIAGWKGIGIKTLFRMQCTEYL